MDCRGGRQIGRGKITLEAFRREMEKSREKTSCAGSMFYGVVPTWLMDRETEVGYGGVC